MIKPYPIIVFVAILICLLQIWLPDFYLTGDGPTHLYNARMLKDVWAGEGDYYLGFYSISAHVDPNWTGHIILAKLLSVASPAVAEKLFITLYVIIFITGFKKLISVVEGNKYLPLVAFVFLFSHTLTKGFYNFNMSIGLSIWLIAMWLSYLKAPGIKKFIIIIVITAITFVTHPIGWVFGMGVCFLSVLSSVISSEKQSKWRFLISQSLLLLLTALPFVWLLYGYNSRHQSDVHLAYHKDRFGKIFEFADFTTHTSAEEVWAGWMGYSLVYIVLIALLYGLVFKKIDKKYLLMILLPFILLFVYLYVPENMSGGGMLDMRARQLLLLSLGLSFMFIKLEHYQTVFFSVLFFVFYSAISIARIPTLVRAGKAISEYISLNASIDKESVLLPLSFSHNGRLVNGDYISDKNWLFQHAAGYIGAANKLIVLDNYEANTGYFPFIWKENKNPYRHLSVNNGIEDQLPDADIAKYEAIASTSVDYILLWCYKDEYRDNEHIDKLLNYIEQHYSVKYVSDKTRAVLYKKKG